MALLPTAGPEYFIILYFHIDIPGPISIAPRSPKSKASSSYQLGNPSKYGLHQLESPSKYRLLAFDLYHSTLEHGIRHSIESGCKVFT